MTTIKKTPRPARPKKATEFPLRVVLVLTVDGEPKGNINLDLQITTPDAGQGVQAVVPADARQLAQVLEPLVGPISASKAKLWTPGQGQMVRLAQKD